MQQKQTLNDKEKRRGGKNPLLRFLIINRYIEKLRIIRLFVIN